tara:strand:- start:31511 stop:31774 length:264 start_codon:yes stop_codon:yes gene_type:complete
MTVKKIEMSELNDLIVASRPLAGKEPFADSTLLLAEFIKAKLQQDVNVDLNIIKEFNTVKQEVRELKKSLKRANRVIDKLLNIQECD